MPDKRLSIPESATLVALMAEAREVSNPELKEKYGFTLTGKERLHLSNEGLVDSWRTGRSFTHVLTDKGWAWCGEELRSLPPRGAGSLGGSLYAVFAGLDRYLARHDLRLADVFAQDAGPAPAEASDLEPRIRAAYAELAAEPAAWVALADLRSKLGGLPRSDVDETLRLMNRQTDVHLVPESNQKVLEARDREAAVIIGNQEKHLLSIGS